jgi:glycosyltransferase involved in cell wall biosynthesis
MTFYPAQIGGPNNTLYWHTTFLNNKGIEPMVISSDYGISEQTVLERGKWLRNDFGSIIYCEERFTGFPMKVVFNTLRNLKEVDVVHFNGMYNRVSLLLIFIVAMIGKPIVLSPRGELFGAAIQRKTFGKKIVVFFYSMIKKRILFHATSVEEQETIKSYFGDVRTEIQANFIMAEYSEKTNDYRKDFLFLGRINPIKNIHVLIESAFKSSTFMKSDARIVIAGKAWLDYEIEYEKQVKDLISSLHMNDKVIFVGHVEGVEKEKLINESYFLVLPSKSENFGNVVLESLINGTPVIASKGTPWQVLDEHNAGYWIDSNWDSLASIIDRALELSVSDYSVLSDNAIKLVKSVYDVNSVENKWIEIYKNISKLPA